jgi:hypothetical protein
MSFLSWLQSRFQPRQPPAKDSVTLDDVGVHLCGRDGLSSSVNWDDIQAVYVATTNEGPFVEDVFFVLATGDLEFVVPQEADGTNELVDRLAKLPGFDSDAFGRAMCCTENHSFLCWKRGENA